MEDLKTASNEDDDGVDLNNMQQAGSDSEKVHRLQELNIVKTVGTGTFARVCLCRHQKSSAYYALKIMSKAELIKLKQVEHVRNEKKVLEQANHPFLVRLVCTFNDPCFLYFLFPYFPGGELFSWLRKATRFPSTTALFYASEIVSAFSYLHSLSIVYRDLKPENLLLDREGHLVITDFGFAKQLHDSRTWTLCGTPDYLAPEIIQSKGHNCAVDWWALGILIYEMLAGYPPFYDETSFGTYEKILSGRVAWPRYIESVAKDLIRRFLVLDRTKRLGNMKGGSDDVMTHKWFKTIDWDDVYEKKVKPPLEPKVDSCWDTSNFERYQETDWSDVKNISERQQTLFQDF